MGTNYVAPTKLETPVVGTVSVSGTTVTIAVTANTTDAEDDWAASGQTFTVLYLTGTEEPAAAAWAGTVKTATGVSYASGSITATIDAALTAGNFIWVKVIAKGNGTTTGDSVASNVGTN